MTQQHYDAFDRFTIEPSGCRAPIFTPKCVAAMVVLRQPNNMEASCCHVATFFYYNDHFKLGAEARPNENLGRRAHRNESLLK